MKRLITASFLFACVLSTQRAAYAGNEVRFADELVASGPGPVVVIQIPADTTLVFDGGPYFLDGRDLLLYATNVVVRGQVKLASWDLANFKPSPAGLPPIPPTPGDCGSRRCTGIAGTKGRVGAIGEKGDSGSSIFLNVEHFSADTGASLVVDANGQKGGKGQHGGTGGSGGTGGAGDDGRDVDFCAHPCPTSGGQGGRGGQGGAGGPGGDGGNGGTVKLGPALWALQQAGATTFAALASGGIGGDSGDPGLPGAGGSGGPRGAGAGVCICSNPPGPGPQGATGPAGTDPSPPSVPGAPGTVTQLP